MTNVFPCLIDTHCHLDFDRYDADRAEVIERASEAGVTRIVNPGVDFESSRRAIALANEHPEIFAAVGLHPNSCGELSDEQIAELRDLASHRRVVAIGEIGVDYYWKKFPPEAQRRGFEAQLRLADELNLPVIVHDREAHDDVLTAIEAFSRERRGDKAIILHSFSGNLTEANRALAVGAYLGVTGAVTYPKSHELRRVGNFAPLDRLLVETDAPFLPPQPRRGQRNEPAWVRWMAEQIAEVKGLPVEAVAEATTANAERVFDFESHQ
ncbi:MAG: TatD family hydrolase [Chloroflexi bacterium]|nr:TatD family hydrolase [Chloroflexota bacterium]